MSACHYSGWGYGDPENPDVHECWPVEGSRVAEWEPFADWPGHGRLRVWSAYGCSDCYTVSQLRRQQEAEMCIQMRPSFARQALRLVGADPDSIGSRFD